MMEPNGTTSLTNPRHHQLSNDAPADLVLKNGRVYTMEAPGGWAEAVVIGKDRIIHVGTAKSAETFIGSGTEVIDLEGRLVLPAFVDSHMHPTHGAYRYCFCLSLFDINEANPVASYLRGTESFCREHPRLSWIQGAGFRRPAFDDIGPRKEWLDRIEPNRPISIVSKDGHSMWVNSRALALAGISSETPDPPNGVIKRDPETGQPAGLLQEAAMDLIKPLIPKPEKDTMKEALLRLQEWLNREGITTVHDAMLELEEPHVFEAYRELALEGRLTVRYRASWRIYPDRDFEADIDRALGLARQLTTPWVKADAFKFFADEVIEEETAYLLEPYAHRHDDWHGLKDWDDGDLEAALTKTLECGGQPHIHVIGDAAARATLDVLEKVQKNTGILNSRPLFAHVQMVTPEDIGRMAELGVVAVVAPYWATIDDYFWELYVPYLGHDRAFYHQYPMKSFLAAGVNLAIHSDFSVNEFDMMWAVYSAMTRRLPQRVFKQLFGQNIGYRWISEEKTELAYGEFGPLPPAGERLSLDEILRAATLGGAYANFLENDLGSIEPGKLADLVVFDRNLFDIDMEDIPKAKVIMTLFEGRIVHRMGGI
jgi:predicted amidohydrolase YtcJ